MLIKLSCVKLASWACSMLRIRLQKKTITRVRSMDRMSGTMGSTSYSTLKSMSTQTYPWVKWRKRSRRQITVNLTLKSGHTSTPMCPKIYTTSIKIGNGRGSRPFLRRLTDLICRKTKRKSLMNLMLRRDSGITPSWAFTESSVNVTSSNLCISFRSIIKERRWERSNIQRFSLSSMVTQSFSSSISKLRCLRGSLNSSKGQSSRRNKMTMTLRWRIRCCAAFTSSFQTIRKVNQSKSCLT